EQPMPSSPLRFLALAIASIMTLSVPAPAEAARKKSQRPTASQSRAAKPRPRTAPRPAPRRATPAPLPVHQDKASQLNRIYEEYWDASMRLNPLQATFRGDTRFNDQLPNFLSPASRQQSHDFMVECPGKVEEIGADGLQRQDLLSSEMVPRDAHVSLAGEQYPAGMMRSDEYYNLSSIIAVRGAGAGAQPFRTVKDYETWSRRTLGIPGLLE